MFKTVKSCQKRRGSSEVGYFDIHENVVRVHLGDRAYLDLHTLKDLEARLELARSFRAHRPTMVNLDRGREAIL